MKTQVSEFTATESQIHLLNIRKWINLSMRINAFSTARTHIYSKVR